MSSPWLWLIGYGPSNMEILLLLGAIGVLFIEGWWWIRRRSRNEAHELETDLAETMAQRELIEHQLAEVQHQCDLKEAQYENELNEIRARYDPDRIKALLDGFHEVIAHEFSRELDVVVSGCMKTVAGLRADQADLRALQNDLGALAFVMKEFAENVLAVARLDRAPPRRQMVDMRGLVEDALVKLMPYAKFRGVELQPDYESLRPIRISRYPVQQAIGNIIENAITASDNGGVVDIALRFENGNLRRAIVDVRDYGDGIKLELRERLFDLNARDDGLSQPGSGIGLHYARKIARLHGGDVVLIESNLHEGSTFRIILPYDESSDAPKVDRVSEGEAP